MIALIVPDVEAMRRDNIADDELRSVMRESLLRLNMQLPVYSQVQSFELRDDVFEKTPKLSIKRYLYH
jgi:long-chain acyl-CoA synthetase